jgi:hypothetical protein
MSYQERRSIVSLISNIIIVALYSAWMIQRYPTAEPYSVEIFRFWGAFFLILIPVSIVAKILIAIFFAIANAIATRQIESDITDERDRLFELKSLRNSLYAFAIGFLVAMVSLVVDLPPTVMFILLFCAGVVSEVIGDVSQFYLYRRGS